MTPTNKIIKVTVSKVYVFTTTSEDVNDFTEDDVLKSDNLDHISTYVDVDDYQETPNRRGKNRQNMRIPK